MAASTSSGFHTHQSWGRTRAPKNLAGTQGGAITTITEVSLVKITAAENATVGYFTENQRYLHVLLEDEHSGDTAPQAIEVYGYSHAFLRWFPLAPSHATAATPAGTAASNVPAPTDEGVVPGANGALPSGRIYRTYEILGVDKVAFVGATNEAGTQTNVYAACSTF